ncbi:hypothetical protein GCM10010172_82760 [Paractinoplanes ferrugineus]|uniref:Bulb-type lectin domain-containing protein n=1 Tax=Paractinoplanes ferrugineus TaxID=113564 RepID=A0A919IZE2_9ACTN|nr:hypothetical protein [Actinoplanes ferrugineus]GIE10597.1 hypothetical protein Afe05nite_24370 [Actinoplanes ferrugineus]
MTTPALLLRDSKIRAAAFALALLATFVAVVAMRATPAVASTKAQRAALAAWWAPVHFQDVDTTGTTSLDGKSDYITSYDFDGDVNARDNWENTGEKPLAAHVYYSVVQTPSFSYLLYTFFHPRDWADGALDDYLEDASEHENDSEGALVIVKNDGSEHGVLKAVITVSHSSFYSWIPAGSDFTSGEEDVDGAIGMMNSTHGDNHLRPWTAAQASTHAVWAMGATRKPSPDLGDQLRNGDGIMYYPGTAAEVPDSANDRDVQYDLIDVFVHSGMWDNRFNTQLFAKPDNFAGDDTGNPHGVACGVGKAGGCGVDSASAPWAWDDADDTAGKGYLASNPGELVHQYFDWPGKPATPDVDYTENLYFGVTAPEPTPTTPTNPYRPDARTFTIRENSREFTTTQPNNSVATYTWTDGEQPREWLTAADAAGTALEYSMTPVPVATWGNPATTVTVNPGATYQTIDGFGGAMTDSAASLLLGASNGNQAMTTLFGTGTGQAGLTMVRSPMGSSDLMADGHDLHTYEDVKGSFSADATASDKRQIAALQQAKSIAGGNFKLIGTPWSAPGWAKRGGALKAKGCGIEADELDVRQAGAYGDYFRKYVDAYSAKGIKPWMVSLQNEPQNCKTAMPTTLLSAGDSVALAGQLKAKLPGDVKVLGWDHNWNDKHYVDALTASGRFDAVGYHCYDGTHYGNQTMAVATYMTECSGFVDQSRNVAQNLGWEVANMLMGPLRYNSKGSIYWSLAQDQNGGPHLNTGDACRTCRGMLTLNSSGQLEPSQDFYYYAQFSAFVKPGSQRIDSGSSRYDDGVSSVAFRNGNTTTVVVLVSDTQLANGGSAGSDERDLRRHILQFNGENAAQKTAWLVGADGYRRWISDGSTFNCLKYDAGMAGPDDLPGGALDKYINLENVWAVCGAYTMGATSELEVGTYIKSGGNARLTLTASGLRAVDSLGRTRWAPSGTGDRLILQEDGNLVLYAGSRAVWASGTMGSGAAWLSIRDDGTFILSDKANKKVWVSDTGARDYKRMIVQYDGDTAAQKTSWLVGNDGNRRWVPDLATFQCLQSAGAGNPVSLSSDVLDKLPNLTDVWAVCGADRLGPNSALESKGYLKAGDYRLTVTATELVLTRNGTRVWGPGRAGAQLKLQTDGNLVLLDSSGNPTWATGTNGKSAGWLVLGTDGSLRLYDAAGKQVWTR